MEEASEEQSLQGFDVNLKFNQPELQITINRLKANELGISVLDISNTFNWH